MEEPRIDTTPEAYTMVVAKKQRELSEAKQRDAYKTVVHAINNFDAEVFLPGMTPQDIDTLNEKLRQHRFYLKSGEKSQYTIQPVILNRPVPK